jgi:flagellar biosynthesis/type III secretory pathway protein FliH
MAVIRQSEARRLAEEAITLDLGDLQRQGDALVTRAREQAASIIAQAHAERERIMRGIEDEARKAGFAKGQAEGLEAGRKQGHDAAMHERKQQLEAIEKNWSDAMQRFEQQRAGMLQSAREDVLSLAVTLTQRVIRRQMEVDPSLIVEQIEACLRVIAKPTSLSIRIAKQDEAVVREALPAVMSRIGSAHSVTLQVDPSAPSGTCVARTAGGGVVDASLETQLARIADSLLPSHEGGAS